MKTINTAFLSLILFTTLFSTAHADYEMIDIGSINDSDFVIPVAINESGAIAGRYRVAHSPLLMEEAVRKGKTNYRGFIWQNGNFTDIGPDPDPKRPQNLTRISLNDKGDVACTIGNMPYVWAQGKLSRLEMVQDKYTGGIVWDLTNTGKVICAFYNDSNNMDLFIVETQILVTKDTGQPSQEEKTDSFLQIGTIDQSPDKIKDIVLTESGRILVITHYMPRTLRSDINPDSDYEPYTSYVYTDGVLQTVGVLHGYFDSIAADINESGQIAGTCYEKDIDMAGIGIRPKSAAFIQEGNTIRNLAPGLTESAIATCINKNGIVGGYLTDKDGKTKAAMWHEGKMTRLSAPKGFEHSWAVDINDKGTAAGYVASQNLAETRAVVWQDGKPYILPTPEGYESRTISINTKGLVLGKVFQKGNTKSTHTVFWKPKD